MKYLNNIQSSFSIKDLERFSGIKAHTLRVWESRHGIFSPERSPGNQRVYSTEDLKRLLSIVLLYDQGHRISQIAALSEKQCIELGQTGLDKEDSFTTAITGLEIAVLDLDNMRLEEWYAKLRSSFDVSTIYFKVFVPLLRKIGILWQSSVISPVYEHFFSSWVILKLNVETDRISIDELAADYEFILFLPEGEFHEISLLYLNYKILLHGRKSIYLGSSLATSDIKALSERFPKAIFATHLTLMQEMDDIIDYVSNFKSEILNHGSHQLWLSGKPIPSEGKKALGSMVTYLSSIEEIEYQFQNLKK